MQMEAVPSGWCSKGKRTVWELAVRSCYNKVTARCSPESSVRTRLTQFSQICRCRHCTALALSPNSLASKALRIIQRFTQFYLPLFQTCLYSPVGYCSIRLCLSVVCRRLCGECVVTKRFLSKLNVYHNTFHDEIQRRPIDWRARTGLCGDLWNWAGMRDKA